MDCSEGVAEARERWVRELGQFVNSIPELLAALGNSPARGSVDFCVWMGLPEAVSPYAPWGDALRELLEGFGFRVITSNSALSSRIDTQLAEVDLIVMFAVTQNVDVECVELCPKFGSKMVICYPNEHITTRAYEIISYKHRVEVVHFALSSLQQVGQSTLGPEIFRRACDRLWAKRAEQARLLKLRETVIVLVQGILSRGHWQTVIKTELKRAGFFVESTNSGWVDFFSFFLPIRWLRNRPAFRVWRDLLAIKDDYPESRMSVLAHSFGTFIVGQLFKSQPEFRVERLAFCGSILPDDFPFADYRTRYARILNDVGCKDPWPALGASSTWGYGPTGTYGFNRPSIQDRWHRHLGHRGFLKPEFCRDFWIPFFSDGEVVSGDHDPELPPNWVRLISGFHIKYIVLLLVCLYLLYTFWPSLSDLVFMLLQRLA